MKVIFLNTWYGKLHEELRAYISQNVEHTAVFCFQEAHGKEQLPYDDLLADTYVRHYAEKLYQAEGSWYANVIYVRKDVEVFDFGTLFANEEMDVGLATYVEIKHDTFEGVVCNVHGIPYPGDKLDNEGRIRQSKNLIEYFSDNKNTIIGGDFNLVPDSDSVKLFTQHNYRNLINDFDIETTRNRITFEQYPHNIQLYADYIFTGPSVRIASFIVPDAIVSDHQPLELTIA